MPRHEEPIPDEKRELIKHTLEGAALATLIGFAAKRMMQDRRLHGSRIEPEDIAQTVAAKALERSGQFRGESEPGTWMGSMVINQIKDEGDRKFLQTEVSYENFDDVIGRGAQDHRDPERIVVEESVAEEIVDDLSQLSSSEKTVLLMHHVLGFSFPEISERLNMNIQTAKSHAKRGRDKLRVMIEERGAA